MQLYNATKSLFQQLEDLLDELKLTEYTAQSESLSGSSIGQHVRHIIELFIELDNGYASGKVNYEKRKRDYQIATDNGFAVNHLRKLLALINRPDKSLLLHTDLTTDDSGGFLLPTSFYREVLFNIEHTVHHMALIRVAVQELTAVELPITFGVAAATLKHQQKLCVQ